MSLDQQTPPTEAPPSDGGSMGLGGWLRLGLVLALLVWLTVATGVYGLVMVLGLVLMITLHELGHFVMARRAGMRCTEFFLGFGPRIWSFHRGGTEYGLKLIPAGAYVKIIGMHDIEDVDPADEPLTYRQQPFWQRFGVAVAGSTMHFVIALVLIYSVLVGFGVPGGSITSADETRWRVGAVTDDSAAAAAGIETGDDIVAIDGEPVATFDDLREVVAARPDTDVVVTLEHEGETRDVTVGLGRHPDDRSIGYLGVGWSLPNERLGPVEAVPATFREFGSISVQSVQALGRFFSPSGISDFAGQVRDANADSAAAEGDAADSSGGTTGASSGSSAAAADDDASGENRVLSLLGVFRIGVDAGELGGVASLMLLFIAINVFIGLFNLLPVLPFDGGHVAIAIYEKFQEWRKGMTTRYLADVGRLIPMTYAVVGLMVMLFLSTVYLDIANPISVR